MVQRAAAGGGPVPLPAMIDALGLAETTPGPLILVTEFVGYLAGHAAGGAALGLAAAALVLWVTFLPSFLLIFALAPRVDRLGAAPRLAGALAGVTAAAVGVIATLAVTFALHVLFAQVGDGPLALPWPAPASFRPAAAAVVAASAWALLARGWPLVPVLGLAALAGAALAMAGFA